ncbi:MAG TPA: AAA family ATPase [Longimicrobium sp.]|nr:AAA family ATPase [Longimicrobium sp.]
MILTGTGEVVSPHVEEISDRIGLLVGDLALSGAEDEMNAQWARALEGEARAFRVISAFWRILSAAAREREADIVLIDVAPNMGAVNRAALICSEHIVIPLRPDFISMYGLRYVGRGLSRWREEWSERRTRNPVADLPMPAREMNPAGYVMMQHAILDAGGNANDLWSRGIPTAYRDAFLDGKLDGSDLAVEDDPHCLATLKNYRSLMPLAAEAHKPMFSLRSADGAIGSHAKAVRDCYRDFEVLARVVASRCEIRLPR